MSSARMYRGSMNYGRNGRYGGANGIASGAGSLVGGSDPGTYKP
jgi:hypothetical protein